MADKDDDLEKDLEELEEDQEEELEEEQEGEVVEKKDDKKSDDDEELEKLAEESEEEDSKEKGESDEEREKIRERRRRQKKLKREKERRERLQSQNTIVELQKKIKQLEDGQGSIHSTIEQEVDYKIENEIKELSTIYNQQQSLMEKAITENDGNAFTKAKNLSDKVWARYNELALAKKQRADVRSSEKEKRKEEQAPSIVLGKDAERLGQKWATDNSWFDPTGSSYDSRIVTEIDTELYNEGYDPESQEYWDELTDRVKDRLPHRFKNKIVQKNNKKPPQIVGGNNDNSAGGIETKLPKEFVQTLKAAGMWNDKKVRNAAIKDYLGNKKRSA